MTTKPSPEPAPDPGLLERDVELATLLDALGSASRGDGRAVLLAGEPGIGKTALADALCRRARASGVRVLWGRCWEAGGQPAWWPFTQALGSLVDDPALDAETVRRAGAALLLVLPEVAAIEPALVPAVAPDAEIVAFAVGRAVGRVLRRCTDRRPCVLVIDDLHAADSASLRLFAVLAQEARGLPLLLVATMRDAEARQRPDAALFADLARDAATIHVPRLTPPGARALLDRVAPGLDDPTAARVLDAAAGNPLYLGEVGALLARGQEGPVPVPPGVRDAIRSRLARLPAPARALIEAVAVLGGDAVLADAAALQGLDAGAAAPALASDLLVAAGARVRVSHGIVREVVYGDLPPEERVRLHVVAAQRLEGHADPEALTEMARHLLAAGPSVRAHDAAMAAARAEASRGAFDQAIDLLGTARSRFDAAGIPTAARVELLTELGRALLRAGRGDPGRATCDEAAALAAGDPVLLARVAVARGSVFKVGVVDPGLVDLLRRALAGIAGRDDALEARLRARLAGAEQPAVPPDAPLASAKEAIAQARRLGDPATLLYVLHDAMSACADYDLPSVRMPYNAETWELARSLGDRWVEMRALVRLVFDRFEQGQVVAAGRTIDALETVARGFGTPSVMWPVCTTRAMRAVFEGRFALADQYVGEALALGGDDPRLTVTLAFHRYFRLRAAERPDEALAHIDHNRGLLQAVTHGDLVLPALTTAALARAGDLDGARRLVPGSVRIIEMGDPGMNAIVAEAVAAVGDRSRAERILPYYVAHRSRFMGGGVMCMVTCDPMERYVGLLLGVLGRADEAIEAHEAAISQLRKSGGRAFLARALLDAADALLARGRPGDSERAARYAAEAGSLADELDQTGLRSRVPAPPAPPVRLVPSDAPFTLVREGDVWAVTSRGNTFRLKDGRGLRVLARLVARPGEEIEAVDLTESQDGPIDAGDSGAVLDVRARSAYRARLLDLREDLEEAEAMGDLGWTERIRAEASALEDELTRGYGLGGRERRAGAASERARSAVTRRVKEAIAKIGEHDPELGAHLEWAVRTGRFCVYLPRRAR